jgi:hypothetical protein
MFGVSTAKWSKKDWETAARILARKAEFPEARGIRRLQKIKRRFISTHQQRASKAGSWETSGTTTCIPDNGTRARKIVNLDLA